MILTRTTNPHKSNKKNTRSFGKY